MKYKFCILVLFLFSKFNGFSQQKFIQHVVAKGETVTKIAERYNIKPAAIYEINPDASKGLKLNGILLIPSTSSNDKKAVTESTQSTVLPKEHVVLAKETLYGIAKQYGIKVADLQNLNPSLAKKGLRVGSTINISTTDNGSTTVVENSPKKEILKVEEKPKLVEAIKVKKETENTAAVSVDTKGNRIKEVLAKETLYGIAKEYGISVSELEKANPILESQSLKIGQKLIIPTSENLNVTQEKVILKKEDPKEKPNNVVPTTVEKKPEVKAEYDTEIEIFHEILAKETKYGIAREFGITVNELENQNPKIIKKFLIGEKLSIRTLKSNIKTSSTYSLTNDALVKEEPKEIPREEVKSFYGNDFVEQLISTASENIGVRYRTGGTTNDGFDCSGLMCTTFGAYDIQLPRTSFEQSQFGVKINNEEAKKGDLVFFRTNGRSRINHVGMVVEVGPDGEIKFIHASVGNGVIISSNKETYYSKRLTQINRVL